MMTPLSLVLPVLALTLAIAPPPVSAAEDCTRFPKRPATAEEKKIYADGYALFLGMAPAAPAGWDSSDAQKSGVLNEVCAPASEKVISHGFERGYSQREGLDARQANAAAQATAIGRAVQATAKANETKLADITARMQALQVKVQEAVKAQRMQEVEQLMAQTETVMQEYEKALNTSGTQAAAEAIDAEARRDLSASFNVRINVASVDTRGFTSVTVGTRPAFRQLTAAQGGMPAYAQYVVILGGAAGAQTVVTVGGDPARAEALLKAAKLP